jgi:cyclopropane fatty-acyl-phospholipid synthase-like methyltransferase
MMSEADAARHADRVRRYYDNNAARFERYGQGGASIHRAVWGPGVSTRPAAFHYVDELILRALPPTADRPRVVDLGCGVGASLLYLASRTELTGEGITISPAQATRAAQLIADAGATATVRCREGNYLTPPADLTGADLAFSIEAFVHGPDPARYFRSAAGVLRPGGKLVVCDDFLTPRASQPSPAAARWIGEFRHGWRVGSLISAELARDLAAAAGLVLVESLDLTPYLELRRPRDRWISLLVALARPFRIEGDYWHSLVGGNALQRALGAGFLSYRFLVFERRPVP